MGGSTRNAADVFKVLTVSGLRGTRDPTKNWESWQWVSKFVEWQRVWALLKIGNKHILQDIQPPRKSGIQINWMYDISIFWCTSTNGSKTGDFSQWMYHPTSPPWLYFVIAGRRRCLALTSLLRKIAAIHGDFVMRWNICGQLVADQFVPQPDQVIRQMSKASRSKLVENEKYAGGQEQLVWARRSVIFWVEPNHWKTGTDGRDGFSTPLGVQEKDRTTFFGHDISVRYFSTTFPAFQANIFILGCLTRHHGFLQGPGPSDWD